VNEVMRLQIHYDLSPAQAKILALLTANQVVTSRMIEIDNRITKDAKVAVHRLRSRLIASEIEIKSRRDVGYWIEAQSREKVLKVQDGTESSLGGGDVSGNQVSAA